MAAPLHFELDGERGAVVLLLHPIGLDGHLLEPFSSALDLDVRVLRVDLRGHGRSPGPPPSALEGFADDLDALLATEGLGPTHVVGFSFGGMVAQVLALRHPRAVRSLALVATASSFGPFVRAELRERARAAEEGGMEAVVQATLERWFSPELVDSEGVAPCRRHLLALDPAVWAETWRLIATLDAAPRLGEVAVPTLVLAGDLDASTPPWVAEVTARAIPNAELEIVPGGRHMTVIERPELYAARVATFLGRVSGAG